MAVSYRKLKYRLVDEKMSLAKLMRMAGISDYAIKQISKDRDVSTEVLTKICGALHCEVQDIVDFLPEPIAHDETFESKEESQNGR